MASYRPTTRALMQGVRFAILAIAFSWIACSPSLAPRPPPTTGHSDVAARNDVPKSYGERDPRVGSTEPRPQGNQRIRSFEEAKRALLRIYSRHNVDLYCGCTFVSAPGRGLVVDLEACGYVVDRDASRARRIEWEHAVAASTFGRTFTEWTEGAPQCVDRAGKRFRGRKCASKSPEFARMEGDMHNLFPVVGEVNAARGDLPIGILDSPDRRRYGRGRSSVVTFGACRSVIEHGVFFPRPEVRGDIARAALYMDRAYRNRQILEDAQRTLFERWSVEDPPDDWERDRNRAIADIQGNENPFIADVPL